jgi:hypothetical protein
MKRVLNFDADGHYIEGGDDFVQDGTEPAENQYIAALDEHIAFYKPKLVDGEIVEGLTPEEIEMIENQELPPSTQELLEAQVLQNKFDILMLQMGF